MNTGTGHSNGTFARDGTARLRNAAMGVTALMLFSVALLMFNFNIKATVDGALVPIGMLAILAVGGALAMRENNSSSVALAATGVVLVSLSSSAGAALGMLVLQWGMPQADSMLFAADAKMGINVVYIIDWTAGIPAAPQSLRYLYSSSLPLFLLSMLALGLSGRSLELWRACLMYVGTLFTTCLISGLFPAKGAFLGVSERTQALLPENAGVYAFETFDLFYSGTPQHISFATLNGLACFPSFHTAAALIVAQVWWSNRKWRAIISFWCGLVVYSTVPIGGHYLVDLVGGVFVFAIWNALTNCMALGNQRRQYLPVRLHQPIAS